MLGSAKPSPNLLFSFICSNLLRRAALKLTQLLFFDGKQNSAAYLLGKGDLLYQTGAYLHRLQSLFATNIQLNN